MSLYREGAVDIITEKVAFKVQCTSWALLQAYRIRVKEKMQSGFRFFCDSVATEIVFTDY
jgi:hypothetical protein